MVQQFCQMVWRVFTFRDGPNCFPYSMTLLVVLLLGNILLRGILFGLAGPAMWVIVVLNLAVLALFLYALVRWRNVPERFVQSYCALLLLLLCEVLFYRLAGVISLGNVNVYYLLSFIILLWTMMVMTHIVRVTAEIDVMVAVFLVLLYEVVHFVLLVKLADMMIGWLS